ncbi:MAG TPA: FtsX-like permease family protein, partial [Methylophaga sp.]|nr:FtsX-like permease family protein [Methylophaga sp.]
MKFYLRTAWQSLKLRPLFALGIVTTLSITFGILLVMFNLHHVLLVKSLPYSNQDQLYVAVSKVYEEGQLKHSNAASYAAMEHVVKNADRGTFAIANYHAEIATDLDGFPMLRVTDTVANYFSMLGTNFVMGSGFSQDLELNAKEPIAVISYRAWQEHFSGDKNILERKVTINEVGYSIIGVTSQAFVEPALFRVGAQTDIWLPWEYNTWESDVREDWMSLTDQIKMFVLTEQGQTEKEMQHQLNSLIGEKFKQETVGNPIIKNGSYKFDIVPLKDYLLGDSGGSVWFFIAGSIALAIIALINVSNLLLARATEQQRNLAIKATLGASKQTIFSGLLAENTLLTTVSGVFAILFAYILTIEIRDLMQGMLPRIQELSFSWPALLFAIGLILSIGFMFTLLVANSLKYNQLIFTLKSSGKGSGLQVSTRMRKILVVSQIALAAPILVATSNLVVESVKEVFKEPGFEVENRYYANLNTVFNGSPSAERVPLINEIKEKLMELPQVTRVSNSNFLPMMSNRWTTSLQLTDGSNEKITTYTNLIDEQYFPLMGIDLLQGNNFTKEEIQTYKSSSVLINKSLADKITSDGSEIVGKYISWSSGGPYRDFLVIGVVEDVQVPNTPAVDRIYPSRFSNFRFMIETKPGTSLSRQEFLDTVQQVSGSFYIYEYNSVSSLYDALTINNKFIAGVSVLLSLLTVLLASIGIYGVLSYDIDLRRYEIGIRMAIGASPKKIASMIYKENLTLFLLGALV